MGNKRLIILLGSICLVAILAVFPLLLACKAPAEESAPAPVSAEVFKWRAQASTMRADEERCRLTWAGDQIKERSDGRLDITWYYGEELIPSKELFDGIISGTVEFGRTSFGYLTGLVPEANILVGLPGVFRDVPDTYQFAYGEWQIFDRAQKIFEDEYNIILVSPYMMGTGYDIMLKQPISRLDDLKGFKIRSYGALAEWIGKTGAAMTYIPGGETYTALAMGTVDGATWSGPGGNFMMRYHEICKYYLFGSTAFMGGAILSNMKAWNSLPDDLKLMLEYHHNQACTLWTQQNKLEDNTALEEMINDWDVTVIELPSEDVARWTAMAEEGWEKIAEKSPRCREWVDLMIDFMEWRGYK